MIFVRTEAAFRSAGRSFSKLKEQLCLSIVPIDDFKKHSTLKHFRLKISGVLSPVWGFPNAKPGILIETDECIVGCESAADTLVHHGQTVVRERLIIHRIPQPYEKAAAGLRSATALTQHT